MFKPFIALVLLALPLLTGCETGQTSGSSSAHSRRSPLSRQEISRIMMDSAIEDDYTPSRPIVRETSEARRVSQSSGRSNTGDGAPSASKGSKKKYGDLRDLFEPGELSPTANFLLRGAQVVPRKYATCRTCGGSGKDYSLILDKTCVVCGGSGRVRVQQWNGRL
jgi:hypothetical protein